MASNLHEYQVIVHPAGLLDVANAGYWTEVVELPACFGVGATLDQAVDKTRKAIIKSVIRQAADSKDSMAQAKEKVSITIILAV
jgi:predicted RNase H-like HicB family nuclease